jgi:hypothetical protein
MTIYFFIEFILVASIFLFIQNISKGKKIAWGFLFINTAMPVALSFNTGYSGYIFYEIAVNTMYILLAIYGYIKFENTIEFKKLICGKKLVYKILVIISIYCILNYFLARQFIATMFDANSFITFLYVLEDIVAIVGLFMVTQRYRFGLLVLVVWQFISLILNLILLSMMTNNADYYVLQIINVFIIIIMSIILIRGYFRSDKMDKDIIS